MPYRGGAPLLTDMLGGVIPVSFNVLGEVLPHIRSGKLRSLAICSAERSQFLPDVPTMREQGFADIAFTEWLGWFLPARRRADLVNRLNSLVREELQSPELCRAPRQLGAGAASPVARGIRGLIKQDYDKWAAGREGHGFQDHRMTIQTESSPMRLTGAQALVRILAAEQVPFAFGVVGGKLAPLLHALTHEPAIRFVGTRHEAHAAMMAAATFARERRVAVALGEMGPGGLNLAAGAGVAFDNNLPRCSSPPTSIAPPLIRTAACSWTSTRARCCSRSPSGMRSCTTRAACRSWRGARFARR